MAVVALTVVAAWAGVAPARAAELTLRPSAGTAIAGTEYTLTARVTDAGNPLAGVPVRFYSPDCVPSEVRITDSSGDAACFFTRSFPSTQHISAVADLNGDGEVDFGEPSDSAIVEWIAGPATSLTLEPTSQVRVVNTENCVTAAPRDAGNQSTSGRLVRFVVSGANPTVHAQRSEHFGARFCYTGRLAGEDQITAYVDEDEDGVDDESEPSATATKLWLAERAVLTVSPEQSSALVGSNHTVTATVTTAGGTPLPGVSVDFDADGLVFDGCTIALQEVTDSTGRAFCTYTSDEPRQVNLAVRADVDNDGVARVIARHSWLSGDATTVELRPEFSLHQVGGTQACVIVRDVKDAEGRFAGDKLVQVEITGAHPGTRSVRTNAFGNVGFCYPGVRAGDDRITAFVDNNENGVDDGALEPEAAPATITWFSEAPVLSLTPRSGSALVRTTRTVTARLTTAGGAPIAGIPITFYTDSPSANTVICDDFVLTLATDAQGEVSCVYSGTRPGTDQIRAVADLDNSISHTSEVAVGSATFTWTSGDADLLRLEPETGLAELGDEECLTASALDDGGESGFVQAVDKVVLLTVTGANEASDSARTDQQGRAELCYVPTNPGDDTLTAFVDNNENGADDGDSEPEATATRNWLEPLPAPVVSLTPEDSTGPVGSTHTLTATVTTADGTPLPEEEVLFEDEGGPNFYFCTPDPELTDSQGQTTCSYTGDDAGTDTVRAFLDLNGDFFPQPSEPSDIATRTWNLIPAESLAVQGAQARGPQVARARERPRALRAAGRRCDSPWRRGCRSRRRDRPDRAGGRSTQRARAGRAGDRPLPLRVIDLVSKRRRGRHGGRRRRRVRSDDRESGAGLPCSVHDREPACQAAKLLTCGAVAGLAAPGRRQAEAGDDVRRRAGQDHARDAGRAARSQPPRQAAIRRVRTRRAQRVATRLETRQR